MSLIWYSYSIDNSDAMLLITTWEDNVHRTCDTERQRKEREAGIWGRGGEEGN